MSLLRTEETEKLLWLLRETFEPERCGSSSFLKAEDGATILEVLVCDQGRHLQECSGAPGGKVPSGVLFQCFWAPASECPKECFLSAFWLFLAPKRPKSTQKALFGALGARCPKTLKKHSGGHFPARAPEHSCKWRP